MVPLNLAGVLRDPVEQGRLEVMGVVVTESSGGSPLYSTNFPSAMIRTTAKQRSQPLKRLAIHSTSTCSLQATTYAKCIVATYKDVTKDICETEFLQFKICLRDAVRHQVLSTLLSLI